MVMISALVCIYYNIIMAWNFYYLFSSFTTRLPWSTCDNAWNTPQCIVRDGSLNDFQLTSSLHNITSFNMTLSANFGNGTSLQGTGQRTSASEEFWIRHVLQLSTGIEYLGNIRLELLGCLVLAWIIIFLCLIKGVKSSGKIVYVSATLPYLILVILFSRGLMLPGALDGIKLFYKPDWRALRDIKIWIAAATQIFYSQAAGWGGLITMASYNKFHHNCYRDAIMLPFINSGTSIFAGTVVFSFIGYMAHKTKVPIRSVIQKGPGLAFVVYTEAVANMPFPYVWASLFFLMIFTVGIDSQFAMFETCVSAFTDEFPQFLARRKLAFCGFMCALLCLLGIPSVAQGGMYVLQLIDHYSAAFSLMVISLLELFAINYVYGTEKFMMDIEIMINKKPSAYWKILWRYVTPAIIIGLLISSIVYFEPLTYNDTYTYPQWATVVGWLLALASLVPLPILMYVAIHKSPGKTCYQKFKNSLKPTEKWGPYLEQDCIEYKEKMAILKSRNNLVKPDDTEHKNLDNVLVLNGFHKGNDEQDSLRDQEWNQLQDHHKF
ncbi:unnamed protein product [Gordionus sp. m RMFG-2023]